MPSYGKRSSDNLATCDQEMQRLFNEVIKHYDCSVLCGYRGEEAQNEAYANKRSTKQFPHSMHNQLPSPAVDVVPFPIDWDDMDRFRHFAGFVEGIAAMMGIDVTNGGDWDKDHIFDDQRFIDMPHWQRKV